MIDSTEVNRIFHDCLFRDGEDTSAHVPAEGIVTNVGFHPERLAGHKEAIDAFLEQLPDDFHAGKGGGMSFLQACCDKNGEQWAGEHRSMEQLFQLGIGIGRVKACLPREVWPMLPGGMPYYAILAA